jgi:hypothetical protein
MKLPTRVQSEPAAVYETKMYAYGDFHIVTSRIRIQALIWKLLTDHKESNSA